MALQFLPQPLVHIRLDPVVAVHKSNQICGRMPYPFFPCGSQTAVFFMNHPDIGIPVRIVITDCRTAVQRTIVYQKNLQISISLRQNTVHAALQHIFHPIYRHDYADFLSHTASCILFKSLS